MTRSRIPMTNRQVWVLAILMAVLSAMAVVWAQAPAQRARAEMRNGKGETVGTVQLTGTPAGVLLHGSLSLPPGTHAFHIHAVGKCEGPDFKSAAGARIACGVVVK